MGPNIEQWYLEYMDIVWASIRLYDISRLSDFTAIKSYCINIRCWFQNLNVHCACILRVVRCNVWTSRFYQGIAAAPGQAHSMDLSRSGLLPRMVSSADQNIGSMRDSWHLDAGPFGQHQAQFAHLPVYSLALREVAYSPLNHIHFDLPRPSMSSNMKSRIGASLTLPPLMSNSSQMDAAELHKTR